MHVAGVIAVGILETFEFRKRPDTKPMPHNYHEPLVMLQETNFIFLQPPLEDPKWPYQHALQL